MDSKINIRKLFYLLIICLIAACSIWYYAVRQKSPEEKIIAVLEEISRCVGKESGESGAVALMKIHNCSNLFMNPCLIEIEGTMFNDEIPVSQIQSLLTRYRGQFTEVRVEVQNFKIKLSEQDSALFHCSGVLRGYLKTGKYLSEVRDLHGTAKLNSDGKWKITSLQAANVLEK